MKHFVFLALAFGMAAPSMAQKHKLEQTPQIPESSRTSTLRALHNAHDGSERPMAPINNTYTSETTPSDIPEGWTAEQYLRWLDGPLPDGWTKDQWAMYIQEHRQTVMDRINRTEP